MNPDSPHNSLPIAGSQVLRGRLSRPSHRLAAAVAAVALGTVMLIDATVIAGAIGTVGQDRGVVKGEALLEDAFDDITHPIYYPVPPNRHRELAFDGPLPEELLHEFTELHTTMKYQLAAEVARGLISACPDRPEGHYNLACSLARMHKTDAAFEALDAAVNAGWRRMVHTALDTDLELLRDEPRFAELMKRMATEAHTERIVPSFLRESGPQPIINDLTASTPKLLERFDVPGVSVALVKNRRMVWSGAFGASAPHLDTPMSEHDPFLLEAPVHLMALIAAGQMEQEEKMDIARTLHLADTHALRDKTERLASFAQLRRRVDADANLRARLLSSDHADPRLTRSDVRRREIDRTLWPITRVIPRTLDWIVQTVETASRESFYTYCRENIFNRADMGATMFALPHEKERFGQSQLDDRRDAADGNVSRGDASTAGQTEPPVAMGIASPVRIPDLVVGHTHMGTPLEPMWPDSTGQIAPVRTTAADLGRLVASLMRTGGQIWTIGGEDNEPHGDGARQHPLLERPLESVLKNPDVRELGLGLEVHLDETTGGSRIQVFEVSNGVGCLIRWYPRAGSGIVVLFNSENGPDVALRIAHMALGGE